MTTEQMVEDIQAVATRILLSQTPRSSEQTMTVAVLLWLVDSLELGRVSEIYRAAVQLDFSDAHKEAVQP